MDVLKETEGKMSGALEHLKEELRTMRTGRANPGMIDKVNVEVYGAQMSVKDLGTITVAEARQLVIAPFDQNNLHAISKGIDAANLNVRVMVDGNVVRVMVPEMDESVRKDMVKVAKRKCEETKVSIRNARRDGNETLKKQKGDGDIPEDMLKKGEKKIQELTDRFCKEAETMTQNKEKEILTI